jgi:aspartate kinase
MKVFKFGGASINSIERIQNVAKIISSFDEPLIIVVSALGKNTNALEEAIGLVSSNKPKAIELLAQIRDNHLQMAESLNNGMASSFQDKINDFYTQTVDFIENVKPGTEEDFIYDQIICLGELMSTKLLSQYLFSLDMDNKWVDVRNWIVTDNTYRDAKVCWDETAENINREVVPDKKGLRIITQGFIGRDKEGYTTSLGREGSDFTASIIAYCLNAEAVYIWKDVSGVLNADPRYFDEVTRIGHLSYRDAIEMTYYGAKVIHPKTIKPLQNKKIPLFVKSFLEPDAEGTIIKENLQYAFLPPVIVVKTKQVLMQIFSRDFSFITENNLSFIYDRFAKLKIKMNMIQNTAISFNVCFDYDEKKLQKLTKSLTGQFDIKSEMSLKLLTLRYYNDNIIQEMTVGKTILLEERIRNTAQFLMKD